MLKCSVKSNCFLLLKSTPYKLEVVTSKLQYVISVKDLENICCKGCKNKVLKIT